MANLAATNKQIPSESILNYFGQQTYLGNQYIASQASVAITTSETNLFLLANPGVQTGNSKALFVNLFKLMALTAASTASLRVYLNPTTSAAGSAATVANARSSYGVAGVVGVATTGPTSSASGTLIDIIGSSALVYSQSTNLVILDPGQKILITGTGSGSINIAALVSWYEI